MLTGDRAALLALAAFVVAVLLLRFVAWRLLHLGLRGVPAMAGRMARSSAWRRADPIRAGLRRRMPRLYGFIARRLDPTVFTGLPLTLMVAAAVYLAALLGGLIEDLYEADELVAFDTAAGDLAAPVRDSFLLGLFLWLTNLGSNPALLAVVIVATGFLWADRRPVYILPLWVAVLGATATTWIGKFGFDRTRPEFLTEATALSPSFPSAHATGAAAVYGFIAYAIVRDSLSPRRRFEVTFWTLVLVALIGFSRIFLSVHYASDVAAGFLVGGFWLLVAFALAEYRRRHTVPPSDGS